MARRRSKPMSSSLDLFLDTICNAFGGIMFLSILISVLLQFRGKDSFVDVDQPTISESDFQQLEDRMAKIQSERVELMATIASLEKAMVGSDQAKIIELQSELAQTEKKRAKAVERQIETSQRVIQVQTQVRVQRQELSELEKRLVVARASLFEKSNAVDEALDSREQKMELPKVRSTSKGNLLFLFRYGKLYLVTDVTDPIGRGYYSPHVSEKTSLGVTRIAPRQNAGWDMSRPVDVDAFESMVSGHPSSSTFFSCAVWPDSFEQFGTFKENLLRLGYDYQLLPVDQVDDLAIGRGGSALVQ